MIICSCNVLSDDEVRSALAGFDQPPRTAGEVYGCLGCSPQCGRCARTIRRILDEALGSCAEACGRCPIGPPDVPEPSLMSAAEEVQTSA